MNHSSICFAKTMGVSSVLAILLSVGNTSQAGTELKSDAPDPATQNNRSLDTLSPAAQSNLRCWQDGTLLFEEINVNERSLSTARQVLVFERAASEKSGELFLIETGSATCLYKKA